MLQAQARSAHVLLVTTCCHLHCIGRLSLGGIPAALVQVLRFYCIWDDRMAMYGDRHPYRLHYFLEDDTVEILEVHEGNSGRDPFPVFLRRAPLPKVRTGSVAA